MSPDYHKIMFIIFDKTAYILENSGKQKISRNQIKPKSLEIVFFILLFFSQIWFQNLENLDCVHGSVIASPEHGTCARKHVSHVFLFTFRTNFLEFNSADTTTRMKRKGTLN